MTRHAPDAGGFYALLVLIVASAILQTLPSGWPYAVLPVLWLGAAACRLYTIAPRNTVRRGKLAAALVDVLSVREERSRALIRAACSRPALLLWLAAMAVWPAWTAWNGAGGEDAATVLTLAPAFWLAQSYALAERRARIILAVGLAVGLVAGLAAGLPVLTLDMEGGAAPPQELSGVVLAALPHVIALTVFMRALIRRRRFRIYAVIGLGCVLSLLPLSLLPLSLLIETPVLTAVRFALWMAAAACWGQGWPQARQRFFLYSSRSRFSFHGARRRFRPHTP